MGLRFIYRPPEERFVARCSGPDCGCRWLNLSLGWLRIWPLWKRRCWGRWLSWRDAGVCLRAHRTRQQERPIGHVDEQGHYTYYPNR